MSNLIQGRSFSDGILGNALTGALGGLLGGLSNNQSWALDHFDPTGGVQLADTGSSVYGGQLTLDISPRTWGRILSGAGGLAFAGLGVGLIRSGHPIGMIAGAVSVFIGVSFIYQGLFPDEKF